MFVVVVVFVSENAKLLIAFLFFQAHFEISNIQMEIRLTVRYISLELKEKLRVGDVKLESSVC